MSKHGTKNMYGAYYYNKNPFIPFHWDTALIDKNKNIKVCSGLKLVLQYGILCGSANECHRACNFYVSSILFTFNCYVLYDVIFIIYNLLLNSLRRC